MVDGVKNIKIIQPAQGSNPCRDTTPLCIIIFVFFSLNENKLAFGQTRFAAAADPIEHISEEKFLLKIFAKMEGGPY